MRKLFAVLFIIIMLFSAAFADVPEYVGTWACIYHVSNDSTTFIMFQLLEDGTALYMNQFFYMDHAGMTEKGVWKWEDIGERFFRIVTDDDRYFYFEMTDHDHLDGGHNLIYYRCPMED